MKNRNVFGSDFCTQYSVSMSNITSLFLLYAYGINALWIEVCSVSLTWWNLRLDGPLDIRQDISPWRVRRPLLRPCPKNNLWKFGLNFENFVSEIDYIFHIRVCFPKCLQTSARVVMNHFSLKSNQTATPKSRAHLVHPHRGVYRTMSSCVAVVTITGKESLPYRTSFAYSFAADDI